MIENVRSITYNRVHPLLSPLPDSRDIPRHALMDTNNGVLFMETIILVRYDNTFICPSVKIKIVWLRRTVAPSSVAA